MEDVIVLLPLYPLYPESFDPYLLSWVKEEMDANILFVSSTSPINSEGDFLSKRNSDKEPCSFT